MRCPSFPNTESVLPYHVGYDGFLQCLAENALTRKLLHRNSSALEHKCKKKMFEEGQVGAGS